MGSLVLSEDIFSRMQAHALREYPNECCGLLLVDRGQTKQDIDTKDFYARDICVKDIFVVPNRRERDGTKEHFLIDPLVLYEAEKRVDAEDMEIAGFYHSHPDHPAQPSREDEENMLPGLIYCIMSVEKGKVQAGKCQAQNLIRSFMKKNLDEGAIEIHTDY